MHRARSITTLIAFILLAAGCARAPERPAGTGTLVVSAAASLSDALRAAETAFRDAQPGVAIQFNFGSSGALAQQIEQGAPVDLFLSAGAEPVAILLQKGLVAEGEVRTAARGTLVLIRPKTATPGVSGWESLAQAKRVAIGNPEHVPAGRYSREVLTALGLWAKLQPGLILAEDVRQVLRYVESGEVDAGVVYQTDAATSEKVVVIAPAPAGSHSPVIYPMVVLKEARNAEAARRFATFLLSPKGREILTRYGFAAP